MKLVLSGENLTALYAREKTLLAQWRGEGKQIRPLDCQRQTPEQLLEALGTQTMFGPSQAWQVTGLEKLKSPKLQLQLIEALRDNPDDVLVTVPADLTPAFAKKLAPPAWKAETFKTPKAVFQFLEAIRVLPYSRVHELFRQSLASGEEWGLHALICRQLRILLATKTGATVAAPPFLLNKLRSQARAFQAQELAELLHDFYLIERSVKTGQAKLSWSSQVDIILGRLYDDGH